MGNSTFGSAYNNWQTRVRKYQQAGIPSSVYLPIANQALTKVYSQGSADLTNEQADTAVFAAAKGTNPIMTQVPTHSGAGGFLGNVLGDVGTFVTSLPRLPETLVKDVVSPGEWSKTGQALSSALHDVGSDPGRALRDLATSDQLSLIPGVTDAAKLTTSQGREDLLRHPLFAALDVAPVGKTLAAGVGRGIVRGAEEGAVSGALKAAADAKGKAADVTRTRVHPDTGVTPGDPSALAALVAGKPVLASLRAVDRRLGTVEDPFTGQTLGRGQKAVGTVLSKMGLDMRNQFLSSQASRLGLQLQATAKPELDRIVSMFEPLGTAEQVEAFTRKAELGDTASMSTQEREVFRQVQDWRHERDQDAMTRKIAEYYPGFEGHAGFLTKPDSTVAKTHRQVAAKAERLTQAQDAESAAASKVARLEQTVQQRQAEQLARQNQTAAESAQRLEKSHARVEAQIARTPPGLARQRLVRVLDAHGARMDAERQRTQAQSTKGHDIRVAAAQRLLDRAKGQHQAARTERAQAEKDLRKAGSKHEKARIASPPEVLHPLIAKTYQEGLRNAAQIRLGHGYDDVFKTGGFQGLENTMKATPEGAAEIKALKTDAINTAFQLAHDGLEPAFVHNYDVGNIDHHFSVHAIRSKDTMEKQFKKRALDFTHSTLNLQLAMSREALNTIERKGMQQLADGPLQHLMVSRDEVWPAALKMADAKIKAGQSRLGREQLAQHLLDREFTPWDFARFGLKHTGKTGDLLLPAGVAHNLEMFSGERGGTHAVFGNPAYSRTMRVFRTSVLWGPRHFAHVVVGGLLPLVLSDPIALKELPALMRPVWQAMSGDEAARAVLHERGLNPDMYTSSFDYEADNPNSPNYGTKIWQQKAGETSARWLKQAWEKTGKPLDEGMKLVEHYAQSLYQASAALHAIKKGADVHDALEHARSLVVSMDTMSPFERTVLKQIMPFYTFCVDHETEALTKRGWVNGRDITEDDTILSMDKNGKLRWSRIKSIYRNEFYDGPMHHIHSRTIDALVTPGHNFPLVTGELRKVEDLRTRHRVRLIGEAVDDEGQVYSDAFVQMIGWAVTEGHYKKNGSGNCTTVEISQKEGTPSVDAIRTCLKEVGARWHEFLAGVGHRIRYFGVTGQMAQEIQRLAPGRVMTADFLLSLTQAQRVLLMETMLWADGHFAGHGQLVFGQKDPDAMDAFVTLCALAGKATSVWTNKKGILYCTVKTSREWNVRNQRRDIEQYQGLVWCPETEFGTFVARRRGKVHVTGNTRFATKFLMQLPIDHPLRVEMLASLSRQAQQEWGTGLPQTMMSLLFLGHPDAKGNIDTINFRNANPFRSLANQFTLGGFISSLNPILSAPFIAAGMNPLDGSLPMHPEVVYDPVTGGLKTERPKGDAMLAMEQFLPELKGLDYFTGWSDSMRVSRAADPGSFTRQMLNTFNIPFAKSTYNLPTQHARQATEALQSAQNAVSDFTTGRKSFGDSIGQYALVPYQGRLISPAQLAQIWGVEQQQAKRYPGGATKAVITPPRLAPVDVLRELQQQYGR